MVCVSLLKILLIMFLCVKASITVEDSLEINLREENFTNNSEIIDNPDKTLLKFREKIGIHLTRLNILKRSLEESWSFVLNYLEKIDENLKDLQQIQYAKTRYNEIILKYDQQISMLKDAKENASVEVLEFLSIEQGYSYLYLSEEKASLFEKVVCLAD